jgi:hypothetical protein
MLWRLDNPQKDKRGFNPTFLFLQQPQSHFYAIGDVMRCEDSLFVWHRVKDCVFYFHSCSPFIKVLEAPIFRSIAVGIGKQFRF